MILILIALVTLTALAIWAAQKDWLFISDFIAPVFVMIGFVGLIAYSFLVFGYIAAGHKANIINREYQTNYTQKELFYASDVIDRIRQLDRKRIELNGNLITGE